MEIGETRSSMVESSRKWNDTGIQLESGATYRFRAEGEWIDGTVTTDADGYESVNVVQRLGTGLRRVPREPWFALIGTIGRGGVPFLIGVERIHTPDSSGELFAFANDVGFAYGNNRGSVTLSVTRLS